MKLFSSVFGFAGSRLDDVEFESDTTWPHACAAKQYGGLWGPHIEANDDLGHCAGALNQHLAWISSRPLSLDRWISVYTDLLIADIISFYTRHHHHYNDPWLVRKFLSCEQWWHNMHGLRHHQTNATLMPSPANLRAQATHPSHGQENQQGSQGQTEEEQKGEKGCTVGEKDGVSIRKSSSVIDSGTKGMAMQIKLYMISFMCCLGFTSEFKWWPCLRTGAAALKASQIYPRKYGVSMARHHKKFLVSVSDCFWMR